MPSKSRIPFSLWLAAPIIALALAAPSPVFGAQDGNGSAAAGSVSKMAVPNPKVTGPIAGGDHGQAFGAMPARDLESAGFVESEYFLGGTARAYANDGPWGADGVWPPR